VPLSILIVPSFMTAEPERTGEGRVTPVLTPMKEDMRDMRMCGFILLDRIGGIDEGRFLIVIVGFGRSNVDGKR
jgi:hypothetical protein